MLLVDLAAMFIAVNLAIIIRYERILPLNFLRNIFAIYLVYASIWILANIIKHKLDFKFLTGSFEDILFISVTNLFSIVVAYLIISKYAFFDLSRAILLISFLISNIFFVSIRLLNRIKILFYPKPKSVGVTTIIYGAGMAGRHIAQSMRTENGDYKLIGFIDDNKEMHGMSIAGLKVLGGIGDLIKIKERFDVTLIVVAIGNIDSVKLLDLHSNCYELSIEVKIIPTLIELLTRDLSVSRLHEISVEDLLGRNEKTLVDLDVSSFFQHKRILITGAGGSIGSELSRQISIYKPLALCMLDRDETALLNLQLSLNSVGLLDDERLILADIRDESRMQEVFEIFRPDIVFHAAALKHLTTLERFPSEAHKTNVLGTLNLLRAAEKFEIKYFINISTDKAADPSSVLGRTKLLTERLVATYAKKNTSRNFLSVRFGNVIGSNGSFLHTFKHQISNGDPVTVVHPEITRFFMTVSEAVHLVLQASIIGSTGSTMILDMGKPISIDAIARHMIKVSGKNLEIRYTGLRPGEKLHENLTSFSEELTPSTHPSILITRVEPLEDLEISYDFRK
jgi:FlaA1/EpsC-like NDP-sugar epimerase